MARPVAVLTAAFLLIAAAPAAAAQDERANAEAFAAAALRFQDAMRDLPRAVRQFVAAEPRCGARRWPARHQDDVYVLRVAQLLRHASLFMAPHLTELSLALHAVDTADPALRSGRTAWRRLRRVNAAVAALPEYDACAELRRWRRSGFERTPALRRSWRAGRTLARFEAEYERRVFRAGERMRALGASQRGIEAFTGSDEEGAGQALAGSRARAAS